MKLEDFNIYDIFKSNLTEGGSTDASIILIQNLEKKLFKKFEFIDEKIKRSEEEAYRFKNELSNNKIQLENLNKGINLLKDESEKLNKNGGLLKELINQKYLEFDNKLSELDNNINNSVLAQINELKEFQRNEIDKALEENKNLKEAADIEEEEKLKSELEEKNNIGLSEGDMKLVKDCIKRTIEFEKTFKVFVNSINVDNIKAEFAKIQEALGNKLSAIDLLDIKDTLSIFYILFF